MIRNPVIVTLFSLSLVFTFLAATVVSLGLYGLTGPFVIHFDSAGVVDFVGESESAANIIIITVVIILVNFILALRLYNRERFLAYVFSGSSFAVSVFALGAAHLISSLN